MLKSDANGNNSWWMEESHHTLKKQAKWLQENMKDVDDRFKTVLQLIQGDADSFAQRAENYYQKRPQLVKQVEGFYRAYRSLAEHYDQFIGNMHQNFPKDRHAQSGISLDSSQMFPFGKQLQFKRLSKSFGGTIKDSDSLQSEQCDEESSVSNEHSADASHISCAEAKVCPPSAEQEESSASSSDIEYEHANQETGKLQQVLLNLKVENKGLLDASKRLAEECDAAKKLVVSLQQEHFKLQENNNLLTNETALLKDVRQRLEEEASRLLKDKIVMESEVRNGVETLKRLEMEIRLLQESHAQNEERVVAEVKRLHELEEEFHKLTKEKVKLEDDIIVSAEKEKAVLAVLRFMKGETVCFLRKNKKLQDDLADMMDQKVTAGISLINQNAEISRLNKELVDLRAKLAAIHEKYSQLQEDNNKHKSLLVDIAEEKRNAISQLCFCIEIMKERITKMENIIRIYKRKYEEFSSATHQSGWKSLFTNHWMRPGPQPCLVGS